MQFRDVCVVPLLVVVRLERVDDAEEEESNSTAKSDCRKLVSSFCLKVDVYLTITHTDLASNGAATNNSACCANGMSSGCAGSDPPVVRACSHGNSSNLAAVSPLSEEGHDESLHPCWAEKQRKKVVDTAQSSRE